MARAKQTPPLYERDFCHWTAEQAAALRAAAARRLDLALDFENLAEEIESLGRSDRRALVSHIKRVIEHLLKLNSRLHLLGFQLRCLSLSLSGCLYVSASLSELNDYRQDGGR